MRILAEDIVKSKLEIKCSKCGRRFVPDDEKNLELCPRCRPGGERKTKEVTSRNPLSSQPPKGTRAHHYSHHLRRHVWIDGKRRFFPNRMEYNYYLYLKWQKEKRLIANFQYQPNEFDFRPCGYDRGTVGYRPDFLVITMEGECFYIETKGHRNSTSRTKERRMKKCFPKIKVVTVDYDAYKELERDMKKIVPGWESGEKGIQNLKCKVKN